MIPALIRKVYDAKFGGRDFIEVWGDGSASREFLYVDDAARGIVLAAERYEKDQPVNLGAHMEITIRQLVEQICEAFDFGGEIRRDTTKPNGQPRRSLDVSRAEREFGFRASTDFAAGLKSTVDWWIATQREAAVREPAVS